MTQLSRLKELCSQRFSLGLFLLLLIAFFIRFIQYQEFISSNPYSQAFFSDDWIYWVMAGGKAAGEWIDHSTPFLSAPLYPFLLGGLRWLGLNLPAIFFVQLCLGVITTGLIVLGARKRYGKFAALLAGLIFTLAEEPVLSFTKIMADSFQLFLIVLVWFVWRRRLDHEQPGFTSAFILGLLIGLLCLIWPAAQLLIPVLVISYFLSTRQEKTDLKKASAFSLFSLVAIVLIIGPVTWHNYKTDQNFILISANSGINLLQGNHPNSQGYITPIDGIRTDRQNMFADAKQVYERAHGESASWKTIDSYFGDQAKDFIFNKPDQSLPLFLNKFYWFLSSLHYDNIGIRKLEKEHGLYQTSWLSPIALPWLMGLSLLGLLLYFNSFRQFLPELAFIGLTVFVCVLFHYSARYRLPAAPFLCLASAITISQWRNIPLLKFSYLKLAVVLLPIVFLLINLKTGFASVDFLRADTATKVSHAYVEAGDKAYRLEQYLQASDYYEKAVQADQDYLTPRLRLLHIKENQPKLLSETSTDTALQGQFSSHPDLLRYQYNIASENKDWPAAVDSLNKLSSQSPRDKRIKQKLIWLVGSCLDSNNTTMQELALDTAREWLGHSKGKERITAYTGLAVAQYANAENEQAMKSLEIASRLAKKSGLNEQVSDLSYLIDRVNRGEKLECKSAPFDIPLPIDLSKPHPMDFISLE